MAIDKAARNTIGGAMESNRGAGEFCIYEIPPGGQDGDGEAFVWTAARKAPIPALGGARAAPIGPWEMEASLRSVRTDYSGALVPSKQVLGSKHEPFNWHGIWDDRYNFPGYAVKERRRFERVCFRGNVVKVSWKNEEFYVFIDKVRVTIYQEWRIGYSLTVDVHCRTDNSELKRTFPESTNPSDELDGLDAIMVALADAHAGRPAHALTGTNTSPITAALAAASDRLDSIAKALDTKTGVLSPIGDFRAMATQFRTLEGDYTRVLAALVHARSDLDVGIRSAKDVLNFEDWSRNTSTMCRLARGGSHKAARGMDQRDTGKGLSVYRPRKGQSLYDISRQCYGTPFNTRQIVIANNLTSTLLTGAELLVIPRLGTP